MPQTISAITLVTHDMAAAVRFYESLGFKARAGASAAFTSFPLGQTWLNLIAAADNSTNNSTGPKLLWGRVIIHVDDVDALYERVQRAGYNAEFPPSDASWGERYFHVKDPDGHELSFAKPL